MNPWRQGDGPQPGSTQVAVSAEGPRGSDLRVLGGLMPR